MLAYGVLELGIALWALALPAAIRAVSALYLGWLGGLDALPETLGIATHAFHLAGAFAVLVPCTALMGATLPLLASYAVTRDDQIGSRVGLLYAANTTGAIAGTVTAAFVLLPALGLRDTVHVGAAVNALVFAAAAALARRAPRGAAAPAPRARGIPWILPAIAISGAVSFGYEVLWFRLLGQVLGGSTAAFSTMLASFLAGIALGSALASRWAATPAAASLGFAAAQLATGAMRVARVPRRRSLPRLGRRARRVGERARARRAARGRDAAAAHALHRRDVSVCGAPARARRERCDRRERARLRVEYGRLDRGRDRHRLLPAARGSASRRRYVWARSRNLALALGASLLARPARRPLAAAAVAAAIALAVLPTARPDHLLRASPLGGTYDRRVQPTSRSAARRRWACSAAAWVAAHQQRAARIVHPPGGLPARAHARRNGSRSCRCSCAPTPRAW